MTSPLYLRGNQKELRRTASRHLLSDTFLIDRWEDISSGDCFQFEFGRTRSANSVN